MSAASNWAAKALGYTFSDTGLLERALTHKSRSARHNERLEFLGDAVLDMVISDALYRIQPEADEHVLTRWRSRLVRGETLAEVAGGLGLEKHLNLGQGEHQRPSILADTLEALYGAVWLDGGYVGAANVIQRHFASRLAEPPPVDNLKDPKSQLQEMLQARGLQLPVYEQLEQTGPVHAPRFVVACCVADLDITTAGSGSSRRKAEQRAAAKAISEIEQP